LNRTQSPGEFDFLLQDFSHYRAMGCRPFRSYRGGGGLTRQNEARLVGATPEMDGTGFCHAAFLAQRAALRGSSNRGLRRCGLELIQGALETIGHFGKLSDKDLR